MLKDTHLTLLPLAMSIKDIEEKEKLPNGAPKVGFFLYLLVQSIQQVCLAHLPFFLH